MFSLKKRRLGKTNLYVTELSFGAMNLRLASSLQEANKLLDFVISSGINLFDTAKSYNGYIGVDFVESEVLIGEAIKRSKLSYFSEPLIIVTKGHSYTSSSIIQNIFESRSRLQIQGHHILSIGNVPIILIYLLHGITTERWTVIKNFGALPQLLQQKECGNINFIGFSSHEPFRQEIIEAVDMQIFDVVELPYNVFNRSLREEGASDLLKYIYEKDIGIVNMKALGGNGFADLFKEFYRFIPVTYKDMIPFCLANPYISTVDVGARSVVEMDMDIQATSTSLTNQKQEEIIVFADKIKPHLDSMCRGCLHCLEKFSCPNGVNFVEILLLFNKFLLSKILDLPISKSEMEHRYARIMSTSKSCIGCGQCLSWCEYTLDIPRLLLRADDLLNCS